MYFHSKRSDSTKNFSSSMKLDVRLEQIRSCVVLKDAIAKNFVENEHHSFTSVFTFSVVVVDLPIDCILSFLFPAETDVLVPVLSQSTDVVVVNFVVVLKFPNVRRSRTPNAGSIAQFSNYNSSRICENPPIKNYGPFIWKTTQRQVCCIRSAE